MTSKAHDNSVPASSELHQAFQEVLTSQTSAYSESTKAPGEELNEELSTWASTNVLLSGEADNFGRIGSSLDNSALRTTDFLSPSSSYPPPFCKETKPFQSFSIPSAIRETRPEKSNPEHNSLPPASSLSFPRSWTAPGFNLTGRTEDFLPQVSSLALPSAPLYYNQNSPLWQPQPFSPSTSLPTVSHLASPSHTLRQYPASPQPTTWNHSSYLQSLDSGLPFSLDQQTSQEAFDSWSNLVSGPGSPSRLLLSRARTGSKGSQDLFRPYSELLESTNPPLAASNQERVDPMSARKFPESATTSSTLQVPSVLVPNASAYARPARSKNPGRPPGRSKSSTAAAAVADDTQSGTRPLSARRKGRPPKNAGKVEANATANPDPDSKQPHDGSDGDDSSGESFGAGNGTGKKKKRRKNKVSKQQPKLPPAPPLSSLPPSCGLRQKAQFGILFVEGERLEASDTTNTWYKAKLSSVRKDLGQVLVHFEGWNSRYDEWIPMFSRRLRPLTEEKFSEHQDKYNVGDFVIARWTTKLSKAGVVVEVLTDPEKYKILYYDHGDRLVTNKGLRRMSPVLREKYAAELQQLLAITSNHPLLKSQQHGDSEHDLPLYQQPPAHASLAVQTPAIIASVGSSLVGQSVPAVQHQLGPSSQQSLTIVARAECTNPVVGTAAIPPSSTNMIEPLLTTKKPSRSRKPPKRLDDFGLEDKKKPRKKREATGKKAASAVLPPVAKLLDASVGDKEPLVVLSTPTETQHEPVKVPPTPGELKLALQNIIQVPGKPDVAVTPVVRSEDHAIVRSVSMPEPSDNMSVLKSMLKTTTNDKPRSSSSSSAADVVVPSPAKVGSRYEAVTGGTSNVIHLDDLNQVGTVKKIRVKALPKILAPKELIIRMDHNEFKCTVLDCQKSFRKLKLLQGHFRHYHHMKSVDGEYSPGLVHQRKRTQSFENSVDSPETPPSSSNDYTAPFSNFTSSAVFSADFEASKIPGPLPEVPFDELPFFSNTDGFGEIPAEIREPPIMDPYFDGPFLSKYRKPPRDQKRSKKDRKKYDKRGQSSRELLDPYEAMLISQQSFTGDVSESESDDLLHYIQHDHELVHCMCDYELENGFMVQCELCATWQHGACYGIEGLEDVPKHYVCDFCRSPRKVRFSQRMACHDLQYMRSGKLPVFTPLEEEDSSSLFGGSTSSVYAGHPLSSGFYQSPNRVMYQKLADDTSYCNDQLRALKHVGRALLAAEEAQTKTGLLLHNVFRTQVDRVNLQHLLNGIPDEQIDSLNLHDTLASFDTSSTSLNGTEEESDPLPEKVVLNGFLSDLNSTPCTTVVVVVPPETDGSGVSRGSGISSASDLMDSSGPSDVDAFSQSADLATSEVDEVMDYMVEHLGHMDDISRLSAGEISAVLEPGTLETLISDAPRPLATQNTPELLNHKSHECEASPDALPRHQVSSQPSAQGTGPTKISTDELNGATVGNDQAGGSAAMGTNRDDSLLMSEIDPEILKLCLQGDLPAVLKAVHNREEALAVYLDEVEKHILDMEKQCDARYGTQFATTAHLAEKDCQELHEKCYQKQADLRNMERLGFVLSVQSTEKLPARQMPGPLPIPKSFVSSPEIDLARPPLTTRIKLTNGKPKKAPKNSKRTKLTKNEAVTSRLELSISEPPNSISVSQPAPQVYDVS